MTTKPNIIFFFTDQQRWDTCGCYGQKLDTTPHLDKMAEKGILFENAFTCQPVCGPTRAVLQTGRFATEVGCEVNHRMLPINEDTIAKIMRSNGYETGYIGKWHLASEGPHGGDGDFRTKGVPLERRGGYDDFWLASDVLEFTSHSYDGHMFDTENHRREFPEGRYRVDVQTDWTLEYLDSRDQEKPFFLFLSFLEPHHQNDHNCYEGPHGSRERFADFQAPGDLDTEGDWRENYPDYLGCINSLDRSLGRIQQKLSELGIADNTLIVFTSDHGSHFCTRNSEYKRSCHDSSIHVPLVISGPGFEGGSRISDMVSLIDLPPTILASAGLTPPCSMQGAPLQRLAEGSADGWQDDVFVQISESQCGRAVRTNRWTYSVRAPEPTPRNARHSEQYVEDFLYDNDADPHQRSNLVADSAYTAVKDEMRSRLLRRMAQANEPTPEILAPEPQP